MKGGDEMKKTLIVFIIFALVIALTSCGSKEDSVSTKNNPANNAKSNVTTQKSIENIDGIMKSVESTVDSIEDAVDINIDNL